MNNGIHTSVRNSAKEISKLTEFVFSLLPNKEIWITGGYLRSKVMKDVYNISIKYTDIDYLVLGANKNDIIAACPADCHIEKGVRFHKDNEIIDVYTHGLSSIKECRDLTHVDYACIFYNPKTDQIFDYNDEFVRSIETKTFKFVRSNHEPSERIRVLSAVAWIKHTTGFSLHPDSAQIVLEYLNGKNIFKEVSTWLKNTKFTDDAEGILISLLSDAARSYDGKTLSSHGLPSINTE